MTTIGELSRRISLQAPVKTSDGMSAATVSSYTTVDTVWAKKSTHRSNEAVQAMATTGLRVHTFRIYYRKDVKTSWRILEGTKYYNIIGLADVIEGTGKHFLDIIVRNRVCNG